MRFEPTILPAPEGEGRLYLLPGGRIYPSVTTVLTETGLGVDYTGVPPEVLLAAAERGQRVHALAESRLQVGTPAILAVPAGLFLPAGLFGAGAAMADDQDDELDTGFAPYAQALDLAIGELLLEALLVEAAVYSDELGVAGRLDLFTRWAGARPLALIDFKTTTDEHQEAHGRQIAGYQRLLADSIAAGRLDEELVGKIGATRQEAVAAVWGAQRATVYLRRSGRYRVVLHDELNDLFEFEAAATVLRARWRRYLG